MLRISWILWSFVFFAFMLISAKNPDNFLIVLNELEDDQLKEQLVLFELQGIERTVNVSSYDVEKVIAVAKTYLGTKHKMGGESKKGIDCSGLVKKVHEEVGIHLPRICNEQARYGKILANPDTLKQGDLLFFYNSYKSSNPITHSGIYLGDGTFIHTSFSEGVVITPLNNPYWKKRYVFATRLQP